MDNSVVITSAVRTAVGSLGKSFKNISAHELGSEVIKSAIKLSKSTRGKSICDSQKYLQNAHDILQLVG